MAYDERLTDRVRKLLSRHKRIAETKMFGGICFMHRGNMMCGVDGSRLMVRVGPEQYDAALALKHAKVMDITGKPMKGFIFVNQEGYRTDTALRRWLNLGLNFTKTLPLKKKAKNR